MIRCECGRHFEPIAGESMCRVCRTEDRKEWQAKQRAQGTEDFSAWYPKEKSE